MLYPESAEVPYVAEGDMRGSGSPVPAIRSSSSSSSALGLPSSGIQAPISAIGLQGAPSAGGTPSKTAPVVAPLAKAISLHKVRETQSTRCVLRVHLDREKIMHQ